MFHDRWSKGMADVLSSSVKSNSVKQFYKTQREMKVRDGKWGTKGISNNHRPKVKTSIPSEKSSTFSSKRHPRAFHRNYYFGRTTHTESVRNPQAVGIVGAYDVRTIQNRNLGLTEFVQSFLDTINALPSVTQISPQIARTIKVDACVPASVSA
jgi:hypothetical protein